MTTGNLAMKSVTAEVEKRTIGGWIMLVVLIGVGIGLGYVWYRTIATAVHTSRSRGSVPPNFLIWFGLDLIGTVTWIACFFGFYILYLPVAT